MTVTCTLSWSMWWLGYRRPTELYETATNTIRSEGNARHASVVGWHAVSVGEPDAVGDDLGAVLAGCVVGVRAVLDVQRVVAEAAGLPERPRSMLPLSPMVM
jgi:hypothetical protein